MLLDQYQEKVWLFNANMKGTADGYEVYRGDLVLKEGEIADDKGRRKPPLVAIKEAVLAAKDDKLSFVSGFVDELAHAAGSEPVSFRIGMLGGDPRLARCLSTAAALGG